jgi:hypothetical protein
MAKIIGIEGMSPAEISFELQRGGKFVSYRYCVSAVVITFRRGSDIYFIRSGESRVTKGLLWTLLSAGGASRGARFSQFSLSIST